MKTIRILFLVLFIGLFLSCKQQNFNGDINLIGLNNYNDSDLYIVKHTIKKYFGFNCLIKNGIKTKYKGDLNPFLFKRKLYSYDCSKIQRELGYSPTYLLNIFDDINIYITKNELYVNELNINGITYGNEIYINSDFLLKKVVIHELLHNYGMEHCYSYHCLMSNNPNRVSWDVKKDKPIFCSKCKKILPKVIKNKI